MLPLFAQTTYHINGKEVSESAYHFSLYSGLVIFGIVVVTIRILADKLDRARIRSHIRESGGRVLDITWTPFGRGFLGESSDRIYEVTYTTKAGKTITASCKTSLFSDVYWASDTPPDSFPSDGSDANETQCLSCGATISQGIERCSKCGWSYKDTLPKDRND